MKLKRHIQYVALWAATTLLDKFRLFFLHRREHYETFQYIQMYPLEHLVEMRKFSS